MPPQLSSATSTRRLLPGGQPKTPVTRVTRALSLDHSACEAPASGLHSATCGSVTGAWDRHGDSRAFAAKAPGGEAVTITEPRRPTRSVASPTLRSVPSLREILGHSRGRIHDVDAA